MKRKQEHIFITYDNRTQDVHAWSKERKIHVETIKGRYYRGLTPAEILSTEKLPSIHRIEKVHRATPSGKTAASAKRLQPHLCRSFTPTEPIQEPEKKGGPVARLAGMLCANPQFWAHLNEQRTRNNEPASVLNADDARRAVLEECDIRSRKDLDHNPRAARTFHERIRLPFMAWLERRRRVA